MYMVSEKVLYYEFGSCRLDVRNRELVNNGETIPLAQKTFEILCFLVENAGRVMKKEELLDKFWEEEYFEETNLAQQIYRIRRAIRDDETGESYVETLRKYGYRFTADVKEIVENDKDENAASEEPETEDDHYLSGNSAAGNLNGSFNGYHDSYLEENPDGTAVSAPSAASTRRSLYFLGACGLILAAFLGVLYYSSRNSVSEFSEIRSIAILPFQQIGEKEDAKLGLGMADTLISKLSKQDKIVVLPTSSVITFTDEQEGNSTEIGRKLGVDAVLVGTIQRDGELIRINVQCISVGKETPVWSEKFDTKFSDIFKLQDEVAERIAGKFALDSSSFTNASIKNSPHLRYTKNLEAYEEYSMGLYHSNKRNRENLSRAIEYFEKAVEKDPNFVQAIARLADSISLMAYYGYDPNSKERFDKAESLAKRALELDPNCAEAIVVLAFTRDPSKAGLMEERELLKKAISIDPNNAIAHLRLSWSYFFNNEIDDGVRSMEIAQNLDPQSMPVNTALAQTYNFKNEPDKAMSFIDRALEIEPDSFLAKKVKAEIFERKGQYDKALGILDAEGSFDEKGFIYNLTLSRIFARAGERERSLSILETVTNHKDFRRSFNNYYLISLVYLALGERENALSWLSKALEVDAPRVTFLELNYNPDMKALKDDPEFQKMYSSAKAKFKEISF
ncbi:MAG: winged helix-turn-helix domain-containing protein [Pyrinomonadaceae bacterium]